MSIKSTPISEARSGGSSVESSLELVAAEMQAVNAEINRQMESDVALINQLGAYIIQAGGKRFTTRNSACWPPAPASAKPWSNNQAVVSLAAIIEFIHTATLLHDDVVDESCDAPGPGDRQRTFWQRRQRAGRRLSCIHVRSR